MRSKQAEQAERQKQLDEQAKANNIVQDDETDSDDEYRRTSAGDDRGGIFTRQLGPSFGKLKELRPTNRKYRKLLSYRSYRLDRRSQEMTPKEQDKLRSLMKSVDVSMKEYKFDGKDPIRVLPFLQNFWDKVDTLLMTDVPLLKCSVAL